MICKICSNANNNKIFEIREMMFNFRDTFEYLECGNCGCLQIINFPENISKYYPHGSYYSFQDDNSNNNNNNNNSITSKFSIRQVLSKKRDQYILFRDTKIGRILYKFYPRDEPFFEALESLKLNRYSKILDVGCGAGNLLYFLNKKGFKNLMGLDPFIKNGRDGEIKIFKKEIQELDDEECDLIMFNHSFEHIYNQADALFKTSNLLSEGGSCMISMPIKTDYIWELYGTNWVQIDAPRHFFIHTLRSFNLLAKNANFNIEKIIFNSNEFQFWGSEQYERDIPLEAENSYGVNPERSIFTKNRINEFEYRSKELNEEKMGDQAIFILKSKS